VIAWTTRNSTVTAPTNSSNWLVSGALMTASCVYATFVAAGNRGALEPSGVDKVVALYRRTLEYHQEAKKGQLQQQPKQS
jgi:hypothetical protein